MYSAAEEESRRDVVVKVFLDDGDVAMRDNECAVLAALLTSGSQYHSSVGLHVPRVLHSCFTNCGKPVIILDKIGHALQPIGGGKPCASVHNEKIFYAMYIQCMYVCIITYMCS